MRLFYKSEFKRALTPERKYYLSSFAFFPLDRGILDGILMFRMVRHFIFGGIIYFYFYYCLK